MYFPYSLSLLELLSPSKPSFRIMKPRIFNCLNLMLCMCILCVSICSKTYSLFTWLVHVILDLLKNHISVAVLHFIFEEIVKNPLPYRRIDITSITSTHCFVSFSLYLYLEKHIPLSHCTFESVALSGLG